MKYLFRVPGSRFRVVGAPPEVYDSELETRNSKLGTGNPEHAAAAWALGAVLALMPAVASAQIASDPTRPPGALATSDADASVSGAVGLTLQTVMISPTHKAAIINGVMVKLGEKYGDAVLVRVSENQVVLKSGGTEQVLKLYSTVEKHEVKPAEEKREAKPAVAKRSTKPAVAKNASPQGKTRSAAEPAAADGTR